MKILYLGSERHDAQTVAAALRGIAENGTVSWAPSVDQAARWLDENRDLAALLFDAQLDGESWRGLLKRVRGLAVPPAVVVIGPEGTPPRFGSTAAEADEYIPKNSSLFLDLPVVVTRAAARGRGAQD